MTTYGYARISTNDTKKDITRQERELKALGVKVNNVCTRCTTFNNVHTGHNFIYSKHGVSN